MEASLARRIGASLPAVGIGLALLAGLWFMPDLTPAEAIPVVGQESLHGRITDSLGTDASGLPLFEVEVLDGPEAGSRVEAGVQDGSAAMPGSGNREPYLVGDEVVVTRFTGPAGGYAVITEPWRVPLLGIVAAVPLTTFVAALLMVPGNSDTNATS